MRKKYLLFAIFIFVLTGIKAQIPVLNLKKNIFKMDTAFEREALSRSYYRAFNRWFKQADINNDGKLDLILQPYQHQNRAGIVSILYNKSSNASNINYESDNLGNFYTEGDPGQFDVGDVNGDGNSDVLIMTENYHGKPEDKPLEWYVTSSNDHTVDKLFLNRGNGAFTKLTFPDTLNTTSGRLININNDQKKEILITNYTKPIEVDPLRRDQNLIYKYELNNDKLVRKTTFFSDNNNLFSRVGHATEIGNKIYFQLQDISNQFINPVYVISFNKGDSLSVLSPHDTVAVIIPTRKIKDEYSYTYFPVNEFGIHIVDLDNNGTIEVVTQEAMNIKYTDGRSVANDIGDFNLGVNGLSHTRIQVYNKTGNISDQWLDSTMQYDPTRIAHGNGIKLEDINNDGLIDILPIAGWGWWPFTIGDSLIAKDIKKKRILLNKGNKLEAFTLDFKDEKDLNTLQAQAFTYPIFFEKNKPGGILYIKEGGSSSNTSFSDMNGIINIDFSQFKFPCEVYKPEINFQGSLAIPFGLDSTTIAIDSIAGINTLWYKDNKIISFKNTIHISEIGTYKVKRLNLGGCVNEKSFTIVKAPQVIVQTKSTKFNFSIPDIGVESLNGQGLGGALNEATSGAVLYSLNGKEHIIVIPSYSSKPLSPLHFTNEVNGWQFKKYYNNVTMGNARNYVFVDSATIAYADHGLENGNPWPYGDVYTVKNEGDTLNWKKISNHKSFYHSIATGDLNNDGLYDLIGLHMGTYNPWTGINNLHPYLQNSDKSFTEGKDILQDSTFLGENTGAGSVVIADVMGDKKPEIIKAQYGGDPTNPYAYAIYGYDAVSQKFKFLKKPKNKGVFSESKQGSTSIKLADFDKDGKIDMAIASEGYPSTRIQIWQGLGEGEFEPGQILSYNDTAKGYPDSSNTFREFEIADIDNDGWLDIMVHPFHFGNKFRINPGPQNNNPKNGGWVGTGVSIQNSIWKNQNGLFYTLPNKLDVLGTYPGFIKGFYVSKKLKYFGFEQDQDSQNLHSAKLHEYTLFFCNNLVKPLFNTTNFSFCAGDSLKLSISNTNKGDTIKWYFGDKSDLTNVSNKIFKEGLKLHVTRTDSLGCIISSDTVQLKKLAIPDMPIITRDTANNLVSNATIKNTWYKDGTLISDTTQKIKPSGVGSYTVKTTQNGCSSSLSAPYYFLITDVINLSANEFLKLAPNPFNSQLNLDFLINGYQKLNIDIYELSTGRLLFNKQGLYPGTPILLGSLSGGTYIVKVYSSDGKISYQFKMLKI